MQASRELHIETERIRNMDADELLRDTSSINWNQIASDYVRGVGVPFLGSLLKCMCALWLNVSGTLANRYRLHDSMDVDRRPQNQHTEMD